MAHKDIPLDPQIYRLMIEQTRDYALFVLDPEGVVMTWNTGAARIKGYKPEEIIGRHFSVFYVQEAIDRKWPQHELKVAALEGRFEDEGWRLRKDGSRFWASVVLTALRDEQGKLLGFSKITRDLSERKQAEEHLRQSEERFRLLVEGVVDYAVFMLDPEGVVTSWNQGAARIMGYAREEIVDRHFSHFYTLADLEAGKPWEELATARRVGRVEEQGWRIRRNGERFWARTVITALYDDERHLHGFAKVTQDLTQQRQLQSLQVAAQNINEFIATLAHELRNPLAPIRSAVSLMETLSVDGELEKIRKIVDRQSAQLVRIVEDMADISRISRGNLSIRRAPLDIVEVVSYAVEMSAPLLQEAKHELHLDLQGESLMVEGDMNRLTQVLNNLLNNAIRYTPAGGRIFIEGRDENGWLLLKVRDTGRGIEPHMMDSVFQMFVQGEKIERVQEGLGVGLALARKIAELHDGTLVGRSEGKDKGSEFTLRLPLLRKAELPAPTFVQPAPVSLQRVLVVDDNVDAAMALHYLLKSLGHESAMAHNGLDALKRVEEFRPDVVLLDIGMPDLDGYEVARRLRQLKRPLRIVALTGWGQDSDRQKTKDAGFDLHLVKPVDPQDLFRALDDKSPYLH